MDIYLLYNGVDNWCSDDSNLIEAVSVGLGMLRPPQLVGRANNALSRSLRAALPVSWQEALTDCIFKRLQEVRYVGDCTNQV